ncbi:hypothetical protein BRC72_02410 [Halobacteriales archaeon QH_7_66_36]|nr:MAG: hypothetical protein BRC72_02410 [Halobacteriales archaeon QH_7_66_36]
MQEIDSAVSRREFLRPVTVGAGTTLGASSVATVQQQQPVVVELKSEPYIFDGATESPLYVKSGTTVKFDWVSDGHNIHVDSQPEKATSKGVEKIHDTGFTHTHTFDVNGEYHFWCVPRDILPGVNGGASHEAGLRWVGNLGFVSRRDTGSATPPVSLSSVDSGVSWLFSDGIHSGRYCLITLGGWTVSVGITDSLYACKFTDGGAVSPP